MEQLMTDFVEKILTSSLDFEKVTKADLRKQYMKENGVDNISKEDKKVFSIVVDKVLKSMLEIKTKAEKLSGEARTSDDDELSLISNTIAAGGESECLSPNKEEAVTQRHADKEYDCETSEKHVESEDESIATCGSSPSRSQSLKHKSHDISDEDSSNDFGSKDSKKKREAIISSESDTEETDLKTFLTKSENSGHSSEGKEKSDLSEKYKKKSSFLNKKRKISGYSSSHQSSSSSDEEPLFTLKVKNSSDNRQKLNTSSEKQSKNSEISEEQEESGDDVIASGVKSPSKSQSFKPEDSINSDASEEDSENYLLKKNSDNKRKKGRELFLSDSETEDMNSKQAKCGSSVHSSDEKENADVRLKSKKRKSSVTVHQTKNKRLKLSASSSGHYSGSSNSDEEPLSSYKKNPSKGSHRSSTSIKKKIKNNKKEISSEFSSDSSVEGSKPKIEKNKKKGKKPTPSDAKIENLKKYIRAAGLHVQSYTKLFGNCKTIKSKVEKLMELLQKAGMKGRPTLEKCKKLKKRIERKKEVESLDLTNIITSENGRAKRNTRSLYSAIEKSNNELEANSPIKRFSRLKDIVDNEESD